MDDRPKRKAKRDQETLPGHYERGPVAGKDFASAVVIGALAMVFMVLSLRLEVPGSIYTAPGMLPFIVSQSPSFNVVSFT